MFRQDLEGPGLEISFMNFGLEFMSCLGFGQFVRGLGADIFDSRGLRHIRRPPFLGPTPACIFELDTTLQQVVLQGLARRSLFHFWQNHFPSEAFCRALRRLGFVPLVPVPRGWVAGPCAAISGPPVMGAIFQCFFF